MDTRGYTCIYILVATRGDGSPVAPGTVGRGRRGTGPRARPAPPPGEGGGGVGWVTFVYVDYGLVSS